ncbi:hypothetical protein HD554DRAFT_908831 [Boletus coccyginus]|nr:hypothetical protein HD554DRAFT_908831 [Boletus coccyginus]
MITGETQSAQVARICPIIEGGYSSRVLGRRRFWNIIVGTAPELSRSGFPLYDSPLSRYPLLRPRFGPDPSSGVTSFVKLQSGITTASQAGARITCPPSVDFPSPVSCTTSAVSSHSSSPIPLPDLKQLKEVVLLRSLAQLIRCSPDLRVCQYEVPGGGVCRDKDCGELHLSQISREPSDTEVAAYVHGMLPRPWNGRCNARAIEIALEGVRLRRGATDVDSRVREALGGLGIPMN